MGGDRCISPDNRQSGNNDSNNRGRYVDPFWGRSMHPWGDWGMGWPRDDMMAEFFGRPAHRDYRDDGSAAFNNDFFSSRNTNDWFPRNSTFDNLERRMDNVMHRMMNMSGPFGMGTPFSMSGPLPITGGPWSHPYPPPMYHHMPHWAHHPSFQNQWQSWPQQSMLPHTDRTQNQQQDSMVSGQNEQQTTGQSNTQPKARWVSESMEGIWDGDTEPIMKKTRNSFDTEGGVLKRESQKKIGDKILNVVKTKKIAHPSELTDHITWDSETRSRPKNDAFKAEWKQAKKKLTAGPSNAQHPPANTHKALFNNMFNPALPPKGTP